jgi:hypothetical protein
VDYCTKCSYCANRCIPAYANEKKEYKSTAQIATGFTTGDEIRLTDDRYSGPGADIKFSNVIENFTSAKVLSLLSYDLTLHDLTEKYPFRTLSPEQSSMGFLKSCRRKPLSVY